MFCKHRWTNVKKWESGGVLHVIQKCRWCNDWQRLDAPLKSLEGVKSKFQFKDAQMTRRDNVVNDNSQPQIVESEHLEEKKSDDES